MQAVSVESIFSGKAEGHKLRWAEVFLLKHVASSENFIQNLRDLVEDARAAQAWLKLKEPKEQQPDYDKFMARLEGYGESFPTNKKISILEHKLNQLVTNNNVLGFMEAVCPWARPGQKNDSFKPQTPRLSLIEGGLRNNSAFFRSKCLSYLTTLVKRESEGEAQLLACIDTMMDFIDKHNPELEDSDNDQEGEKDDVASDALDTAIDCVVATARAIKLLLFMGSKCLTAHQLASAQVLFDILGAKDLRGPQAASNSWHALSIELSKSATFLKGKIGLFETSLHLYRKHLPKLEALHGSLSSNAVVAANGDIPAFYKQQLKEVLLPAISELPSAHCDEVVEKFGAKLIDVVTTVIRLCTQPEAEHSADHPVIDVLAASTSLRELLPLAHTAFPKLLPNWTEVQSKLSDIHDSTLKQTLIGHAMTVAGRVKGGSALAQDEALINDVEKAITEVNMKCAIMTDTLNNHQAGLQSLADDILAAGEVTEGAKSVRLVSMAKIVVDWVQDDVKKQEYKTTLKGQDLFHELAAARGRWEGSGGIASLRAKGDSTLGLTELLSRRQCAVELLEGPSKAGLANARLQAEVDLCATQVAEAKLCIIDTTEGEIATLHKYCAEALEEMQWHRTAEIGNEAFDEFVQGAQSWLASTLGDKLRAEAEKLASTLQKLEDTYAMFAETLDKTKHQYVAMTCNKVSAMVWCVKVIKSISKDEPSNKKKRYASAKLKECDKQEFNDLRPHIPNAVLMRLAEDKGS